MTANQNHPPRITIKDRVALPITHIPTFRTQIAIQDKVERNLMFKTWGGLGDQICAEPTLRYAKRMFKDCKLALASEQPGLFDHIEFDEVYDLRKAIPRYERYLIFETITPPDESNLVWQFFSHMLTNCVDFPSLCALRSQLPIADREIFLTSKEPTHDRDILHKPFVFVHAGRHWPSKTFPKDWWDKVLKGLIDSNLTPVLIGADTSDNRGTVDVEVDGCFDLRNKLSVEQTVWFLQRARLLITNDSSPLHMAASTDPTNAERTGFCDSMFIATCKHPDYLKHYRKGEFGRFEHNMGLGGMWDIVNCCPNNKEEIKADEVDLEILKSWLPEPEAMVEKATALWFAREG